MGNGKPLKDRGFFLKEADGFFFGAYRLSLIQHKFLFYMAMLMQDDGSFPDALPDGSVAVRGTDFSRYRGLPPNKGYEYLQKGGEGLAQSELCIQETGAGPGGADKRTNTRWLEKYGHEPGSGEAVVGFAPAVAEYLLQMKWFYTTSELAPNDAGIDGLKRVKSVYAFRLYEVLKTEMLCGKAKLTMGVGTLRGIFRAKNCLLDYGSFKEHVLLEPQREMAEKCDICFGFTEIKRGRRVDKIEFDMEWNFGVICGGDAGEAPGPEAEPPAAKPPAAEAAPPGTAGAYANFAISWRLATLLSGLDGSGLEKQDVSFLFAMLRMAGEGGRIPCGTPEGMARRIGWGLAPAAESLALLTRIGVIEEKGSAYYFSRQYAWECGPDGPPPGP